MADKNRLIYLDNNATTRIAPEVFEAMVPYLTEEYGNPSSAYGFGARVKDALQTSREKIAALLNCEPREILFTSCGTESDNAAILSALRTSKKKHIVTTQVEHSAINTYGQHLERQGYAVTWLPVNRDGRLDLSELENAIRDDTAIVSIMWANNETGVLFPIAEIAEICQRKGVLFHTDAVQTPGKIALDMKAVPVNFLSLSGHKLHAPKGIGLLYVRRRTRFTPYVIGGGQEGGKRGGTENVSSIVAFGRAAELAADNLVEEQTHVRALRDRLESGLLGAIPGTSVNGRTDERLPNTTNLGFDGVEAESILHALDAEGICASAGSACTTGSMEPSHVLTAMGLNATQARGSLRLSLSHFNSEADIDHTLAVFPGLIEKLRASTATAA